MLKIIKNPYKEWMYRTELNGQKFIFMTTDFTGKPSYAKIGFGTFIGYFKTLKEHGKYGLKDKES